MRVYVPCKVAVYQTLPDCCRCRCSGNNGYRYTVGECTKDLGPDAPMFEKPCNKLYLTRNDALQSPPVLDSSWECSTCRQDNCHSINLATKAPTPCTIRANATNATDATNNAANNATHKAINNATGATNTTEGTNAATTNTAIKPHTLPMCDELDVVPFNMCSRSEAFAPLLFTEDSGSCQGRSDVIKQTAGVADWADVTPGSDACAQTIRISDSGEPRTLAHMLSSYNIGPNCCGGEQDR